ncbi:MAG: MFS transporter [Paenibacillus dendritiformis]|uniref:MFS transporter n=1 Tax=Paenibacillus dendritiformis TaxID=130049 RepID=UPI001B189EF9|nr:MFS transporter [Paenibacillus dendritiformis]MDU5142405.1 MFS transporter [Paenibacillus dendritiformis]GIO73811.1 MFS transporter [Paenibacillus dendritiformis]
MWANRNVWIVLCGEFVAGLGLWTSIIANLEFMQHQVPSDFMKSVILFIGLLAGVLIGPYAGKVIDSSRKKLVLIYAGLGRMIGVCFMFIALAADSVLWMVLFNITLQISAAFYFPALQSVIPRIVADKDLLTLNGVHMNASTIARIIGTVLAGIMLTAMSLASLYAASLAGYALLLISTFFLDVKEDLPSGKAASPGKKKGGGFKEIVPMLKRMPIAVMALGLSFIPGLFIGGFNLMVINISEIHHDTQIKGWLYAVEGISFIAAAFFVKRISARGGLIKLLCLFALLSALGHSLLFFADIRGMALFGFGLFGLAAGFFFPLLSTYFQKTIPKEYHGRFFSFRTMLDRVMFQVVLLATGLMLDTIGLSYMVLVFGGLSVLFTAYAYARSSRMPERPLEAVPEPGSPSM